MKPIFAILSLSLIAGSLTIAQTETVDSTRTEEIRTLIQNSTPRLQVVHCMAGTSNCRKLVLLKDKAGKPIRSFYMAFSSLELERLSGAVEYVIENPDGSFRSYLHEGLKHLYQGVPGATEINTIFLPESRSIKVTFDKFGFPTIHDIRLAKHGSSKFSNANLSFSNSVSVLSGFEYDSVDSSYKKSLFLTYKRNKSLEPVIKRSR